MEAGLAGERIRAAAERAGQPAVRRPDRRRGGGQRFLPLDVRRTLRSRLSRPCSRSRSTPKVSSGEVSDVEMTLEIAALACGRAAGGPCLHDSRQLLHRARLSRIERRARAEVVDHVLERLNLRGQLAGGCAEVAVLDLECVRGELQLTQLEARTPLRAEADEHRQQQTSRPHRARRRAG